MITDADMEVTWGQGTKTSAKPERGGGTVLSPTGDLRVRVDRERSLNDVDDPVGATGQLADIDVLVSNRQQVADPLEGVEVLTSVLNKSLGLFGRWMGGMGFLPVFST